MICNYTYHGLKCGKDSGHTGAHLLVKTDDLPPTSQPFSNERRENPEQIASEVRKAIDAWKSEGWNPTERRRAMEIMLHRIGDGGSPREAFRAATLEVVRSRPFQPRPFPNHLARKLGLQPEDHHLIERLATEWGDSYTSFVRGLVETWAANHRLLIRERPELDMNYDPAREER